EFIRLLWGKDAVQVKNRPFTRKAVYYVGKALPRFFQSGQFSVRLVGNGYVSGAHSCTHTYVCTVYICLLSLLTSSTAPATLRLRLCRALDVLISGIAVANSIDTVVTSGPRLSNNRESSERTLLKP